MACVESELVENLLSLLVDTFEIGRFVMRATSLSMEKLDLCW